ncbi:inhibitor of apoptosis protein-like [Carcharodon carcharias]|uniref:inhibitor of apoptosis protein-like n=1 Tax=Carcharodon carcharias TaxID=13397 RepID=UPI001B7E8796|nr:inhibitor of apoptosis protein-like [Carcharodon carcharias]XP_041051485.1 inhibitor of apoptosis protein-like [Carcharodon carcharias]XP_041051486.1 inhibitor of apoptosis protein-like [Carcharodon carcharias]XP_041051487.1 inhibitor of apoptosis protein-like [Carcharodon carcharias]XP_041051488.1 inhibitor of apoptosis protein-like [Carcharodon carcharias]
MDITTDCKQDLSNELYRLGTFIDFPSDVPVSDATLARAGFFYTGVKDQVRCFSCGGIVENWQHGDSAIRKHRQLFPACPFINRTCMNEQMNSSFPVMFHDPSNSEEVANHHPSENGPCSHLNGDCQFHNQLLSDPVKSRSIEDMSHLRPKNPAMCSEEARLKTFTTWPSYGIVTPRELAKAGLYYLCKDDHVQCFCCAGLMKNWEPGDRAMSEHKRHFPMCAFVLGHSVGNIPIDPNCSRKYVNQPLNGEPKANFFNLSKHPDKQTLESRLQTFKCPERFPLNTADLAGAGFYSTGDEDNVKCFHCDGGLRNWESSDEAWEQHAKWFPGCGFLNQQRGQDFVSDVQLRKLQSGSTTEAFPQNGLSAHLSESESSLMQTPVVQGALEMGFDSLLIMELVKRKLRSAHDTYSSVEMLVTDLLAAERETQDQEREDQKEDTNLEEQLKKLKEEKCCKICWDRDVCIAFVPCGHIATCRECSAVQKCPICCSQIHERVRIYMS